MALPVPPGYEAFAALAPAPAAPEVIIFSFIYLFIYLFIYFFPFASPVSLTEGFGLRSSYSAASVRPTLI